MSKAQNTTLGSRNFTKSPKKVKNTQAQEVSTLKVQALVPDGKKLREKWKL